MKSPASLNNGSSNSVVSLVESRAAFLAELQTNVNTYKHPVQLGPPAKIFRGSPVFMSFDIEMNPTDWRCRLTSVQGQRSD